MSQAAVIRHSATARFLHWLMASCVLVLLATGLLPVVGVEFNWVPIHWIAGLILAVALIIHILRSLVPSKLARIRFRAGDIKEAMSAALPAGKYSLAQKLMHNVVALFGLAIVGTGLMMLLRIDTPFWTRNPYILSEQAWGAVYVIHGLSALFFLSLVMLHVYFSLRPEKRAYLRAMLKAGPGPESADAGNPES